ncbi:MAG: beta-ketoacyl-ACP synthase II [Alphaproteobacteria bacterium GM7ARS4]|nr:beta-ketoacyl-ACP synthase II [Alphaproteobacteria bacterium GM7ARS4]
MSERVVVTGLGLICPLACGVEASWKRLIEGESGIDVIRSFDTEGWRCRIAGEIPVRQNDEDKEDVFCPDDWIPARERKHVDPFIVYARVAATQAIRDSGWTPSHEEELARSGVVFGSGIGGLDGIYKNAVALHEKGHRRVSPFFVPASLINLAAGGISIEHGWQGPNVSLVTACSSGAHAIGDAAALVRRGDADVVVAGGAESAINPLGVSGFAAMRALSTNFNDRPTQASRPWDTERDGFVMGDGAGAVIIESYSHAKKRGAHIYAEVLGYGLSGDAYHITAPHAEGRGAWQAMRSALRNAQLNPDDISYINAHGTSTPLGDGVEINAVRKAFGHDASHVPMSSTKSSVGHLLGAAGSVEAIFCILAQRDGVIPPTINLNNIDPACQDMDLVAKTARTKKLRYTLSNSFGFGGTNATLIFAPPP